MTGMQSAVLIPMMMFFASLINASTPSNAALRSVKESRKKSDEIA
jgi:hypothetical protein